MGMKASEIIIESNILVRGVQDGLEIYRHEKHNIWLDNGRHWLMKMLGFNMTGYVRADPPATDEYPVGAAPHDVYPPGYSYEDRRIMYIGAGIGGNQQSGPVPTDVGTDYPGGNTQSDADPTILGLERPLRIITGADWARWLVPVSQPAGVTGFPAAYPYKWVRFRGTFDLADLNDAKYPNAAEYPVVPVSELGLYFFDPTANVGKNYIVGDPNYDPPVFALTQALAYATIPTYNKTSSGALIVDWEIRVK
jgi:hypothetical protein